jgi:hypothetical protein
MTKALLLLRSAFYEANPQIIKDLKGLGDDVSSHYNIDKGIKKKNYSLRYQHSWSSIVGRLRIVHFDANNQI